MTPCGIDHLLSVSTSLGACVFPFPERTPAAIIEHTDQAMYRNNRKEQTLRGYQQPGRHT